MSPNSSTWPDLALGTSPNTILKSALRLASLPAYLKTNGDISASMNSRTSLGMVYRASKSTATLARSSTARYQGAAKPQTATMRKRGLLWVNNCPLFLFTSKVLVLLAKSKSASPNRQKSARDNKPMHMRREEDAVIEASHTEHNRLLQRAGERLTAAGKTLQSPTVVIVASLSFRSEQLFSCRAQVQ